MICGARRSLVLLVVLAPAGPLPAADEGSNRDDCVTVLAEGIGKDAMEARANAFRDAVSRVVGSLVSAETLVKNDEVIRDTVLEYSGGFIRSHDVIRTETLASGLVRVRIQATVARLQVLARLRDAKVAVTVQEVKGPTCLPRS